MGVGYVKNKSEWPSCLNEQIEFCPTLGDDLAVFNLGAFGDRRFIWRGTCDLQCVTDYVAHCGLIESNMSHPYADELLSRMPGSWQRPVAEPSVVFTTKNFDGQYIEGEDQLLLIYDQKIQKLYVLYHWNF